MFTLLICVLTASGWNTVFELPAQGHIRDVFVDEAGEYHVVSTENKEIVYSEEGFETGRSDFPEPAAPAFEFELRLQETGREYYSYATVDCIASGETLFTVTLGEVCYLAELPGRVLPAADGGCYAAYTPARAEEYWKLFRLGPSGEILFETEFDLSGGPVISINDMVELPGGGVAVTGVTDECGMNLFMMLLGFDESGEQLFRRREALRFHASGELVGLTGNGDIIACGITGYERDDGFFMPPADTDIFLDCCDIEGNLLWRTTLPLPLSNWPIAMDVAHDGSVVLLASAQNEDGEGERKYYLAVYDPGE